MTDIRHEQNGEHIRRIIETDTQTAVIPHHSPRKHVQVTPSSTTIVNDGADTVTVTVEVVDGLDVFDVGVDEPTVMTVTGTATLLVDGSEVSTSLESGTGTKTITTTKSAGSTVSVEAIDVDGEQVEPDDTEIRVVSA